MNSIINDKKSFLEKYEIIKKIYKENINPTENLNNKDFNNITNLKSIGNFQFCKKDKIFIYRELPNILELKYLSLEKFIFLINEKLYFYAKSEIFIEKKENKFYLYTKNNHTFISQISSDSIFDGYIKLFIKLSKRT